MDRDGVYPGNSVNNHLQFPGMASRGSGCENHGTVVGSIGHVWRNGSFNGVGSVPIPGCADDLKTESSSAAGRDIKSYVSLASGVQFNAA